ncbi:MAG: zinc ribbon domain-containing protein [Myxococcota bacterium]|nr:zinc ribbon domain-containing protein [Myxococcota bacterium]MEC8423371.1 zinc ribbon domain-containing protein [Myxococcota bacterium]
MPLYEYRCPDCGHEFEEIQKVSDPAIRECPACGGTDVGKKIGLSSFALKGSGWYSDHYGLKGGGGSTTEPASSESTSPSPAPAPAPASSNNAGD